MDSQVGGVSVHHVEHGTGPPLVALHGAGVDHREIEAAVEAAVPDVGLRRVYPDLPGMGRSTADGLTSNDDVVTLLAGFVEQLTGEPVLLLGHSYGAYLARGLAARRPDLVRGLALVCPLGERTGQVPEHQVVRQDVDAHDELAPEQRAGFDEYFVVRTRTTARRYRDHVVPGTSLVDEAALERVFSGWSIGLGTGGYDGPTSIVAGRRDSTVGYVDAVGLLGHHPHATLAVVDDAGHALVHERPEVFGALLREWMDRARPELIPGRGTAG
ncbi:alpha/beta fold hydrolase [Modestobacter sp. KNN46-3]|jgi:pimeloyl-ACP methyl ester carboxylesterase|uniref:alpha/beta fold hydrolase n=1 Tax=Modestobacter sp. KNN46-3 TaxID=2711218 RepID=UPI0013DF15A4|nr:alpha/beta hydrolase [Modestobacter sp. KNN46-3]